MKPADSSAPPMILASAGVLVLVQLAWLLRDGYLPLLTTLVSDIGARLGVY